MKKLYWTLMGVGAFLALVPALQFGLVVLSFGLLVPILFMPTIAYYGLCLLPLVLFGSGQLFRVPSVLASLAILIALLFAPGYLINLKSKEIKEQAQRIAQILPLQHIGVTIDVPLGQQHESACNNVCQALLTGSRVSAVQVVDRKTSFINGRTFRILANDFCLPVNTSSNENKLRVERILDGEKCLVSTKKTIAEQVELTFQFPLSQGYLDPSNKMSVSVLNERTLKLELAEMSGTYLVPHFPPYIDFKMEGGIVSGSSRFAGQEQSVNELVLGMLSGETDAISQFRINSFQPAKVDSAKLRGMLNSLLAANPAGYKVNLENTELFKQYLHSLHDTAYLRELIKNDSIGLDLEIMVTLSNKPELIDLAASQIIKYFKTDCERTVYSLLFRLSSSALEPYLDQLLSLKNNGSKCQQEALVLMSGRLGEDPAPGLAKLAASNQYADQMIALEAMCRSDRRWSRSLMPLITKYLPQHCVPTGYYNRDLILVGKQLVAMQNLGGEAETGQWLNDCTAGDRQHYERLLIRKDCE